MRVRRIRQSLLVKTATTLLAADEVERIEVEAVEAAERELERLQDE
jgi:hypothetical protein